MFLAQGTVIEDGTLQATLRTALVMEDHTEAGAPTGTVAGSGSLDDDGIQLDLGGLVSTFEEAILCFSGITERIRVTRSSGNTRLTLMCSRSITYHSLSTLRSLPSFLSF